MKKVFLVAVLVGLVFAGCSKPAYEDVKVQSDQPRPAVEDTSGQGTEQTPPPVAAPSGDQASPDPGVPAQGVPAPPGTVVTPAEPAKVTVPPFFDDKAGRIRDLADYPGASRSNVQFGVMQGAQTMLIVYMTTDKVAAVGAHYEKAAKAAGWTVVTNYKEPEMFKLELKKGDRDEALVQAKKDEGRETVTITVSRIQAPALPKP